MKNEQVIEQIFNLCLQGNFSQKVYIIVDFTSSEIEGVFSTKEKALEHLVEFDSAGNENMDKFYSIREFTVR